MHIEKLCLECGDVIKGRADKKFCDDQCRSNYNNKVNSDLTAEMRNVNNILRKNRRILESVVHDDGKGKISKTKLTDAGFNFKYFTQKQRCSFPSLREAPPTGRSANRAPEPTIHPRYIENSPADLIEQFDKFSLAV